MKQRNLLKCISSFLIAPCIAISFCGLSSCQRGDDPTPPEPVPPGPVPPGPVKPVIIREPIKREWTGCLREDMSVDFMFNDFTFENIDDPSKLDVMGDFELEGAEFSYSIYNFDQHKQSFSVIVSVENASLVDHLKGKFNFIYDEHIVVPDPQGEFDISFLHSREVILPENTTRTETIDQGSAIFTFSGFKCKSIFELEHLAVIFYGEPTKGSVKYCKPVDLRGDSFSVKIAFENVLSETVSGSLQFYYESAEIPVPENKFNCVLDPDYDKPSFTTTDWATVTYYTNRGLEALQEFFGIASFVGRKREIAISMPDAKYYFTQQFPVTVIGQNEDHYDTGDLVPLTYQIDCVVTEVGFDEEHEVETYSPFQCLYDDHGSRSYPWCDIDFETTQKECFVRHFLRTNFINRIETNVVTAIKPVMKKTMNADEDEIYETEETIWCLSPSEMGGKDFDDEGPCYSYYLPCLEEEGHEGLRSAYTFNPNVTERKTTPWWTRSPTFLCVHGSGLIGRHYGDEVGIRPCFCV